MELDFIKLKRDEGPAVWFLNGLAIVKATASETGGAFGLIEQLAPAGSESPYHIHRAEDETFYILEGELEFFSENRRFVRGPGSFVLLPRNIPHGFRVVGDTSARYLVLVTPGGFEGFMIEMGDPASDLSLPEPSEPDMGKLLSLAARYKLEILGSLPIEHSE